MAIYHFHLFPLYDYNHHFGIVNIFCYLYFQVGFHKDIYFVSMPKMMWIKRKNEPKIVLFNCNITYCIKNYIFFLLLLYKTKNAFAVDPFYIWFTFDVYFSYRNRVFLHSQRVLSFFCVRFFSFFVLLAVCSLLKCTFFNSYSTHTQHVIHFC